MAVDTESWMAAANLLPLILTLPVEIGLGLWLLYRLLGWSFLAGLAVFAVVSPIQTLFASFLHSYQKNKLKAMDNRLRLMTEILANIKIVKLYSWYVIYPRRITLFTFYMWVNTCPQKPKLT
jgi:ATP-binding cassette subfamily C (CFTR/MRP) protein 1